MKSVLAVAAGFVAIVVLSLGADLALHAAAPRGFDANGGTTSPALLCVALLYSAAFELFGSYLTARLAPQKPKQHALILGGIGFVLSIAATVAAWQTAPAWYHVIALVTILPLAWAGGEARERQLNKNKMPDQSTEPTVKAAAHQ